jgi:hypothetical protein
MIKIQSLGYVANEVLGDKNLPRGTNFEQVLHFGIRGYRDMNIVGLMPTTKTIRLHVHPGTRSCKLPDDYIEYLRVAIVCRSKCGYETLINLVYNDDIALEAVDTRLQCSNEQTQRVINQICECHDNLHGRTVNPNWQPGQSQWNSYSTGNCNQWNGNGWGGGSNGGGCGCGGNQTAGVNGYCVPNGEEQKWTQVPGQNGQPQCQPLPGTLIQQGCSTGWIGAWGGADFPMWGWANYEGGFYNYGNINFGIGPGFYRGGYRINKELGVIQFDSCFSSCTKVVMEYKSSGFSNTGDAVIPEDCIPALNAYIHWQMNLHGTGPLAERYYMQKQAAMFKEQYVGLAEDVNHRLNAMTEQDYVDVFRRYCFQGVHT